MTSRAEFEVQFPIRWDGGVVAHADLTVRLISDELDPDAWDIDAVETEMECSDGYWRIREISRGTQEWSEVVDWLRHDAKAAGLAGEAWSHRERDVREWEHAA